MVLLNCRTVLSGYCIAVAAAAVDFEKMTSSENSSTTVVTERTERRSGRHPVVVGTPMRGPQTGGS